jgi:hypothetical protein
MRCPGEAGAVRSRARINVKDEHMKPIHAELGDDPQGGLSEASALGITATAAAPVLALCPKLAAAGVDPNTPLEAYRDRNVLALKVRSIGEAAQLRVNCEGQRRLRDRPAAGSTLWRAYSLACAFYREVRCTGYTLG